jgi:hypothetical protein
MTKREFIGQCRLCLEQKTLVDSHIIPNFHYKPLKEREGFFYNLSTNSSQPEKKEQKGLTERLLCLQCDTVRLQKNEEHLARVIFGGYRIEGATNGRFHKFKGFDYRKVKNALLSILWRMSISSHAFFQDVELGNKHEERIRKVIFEDEILSDDEYPITLTAPIYEDKLLGDLILQPDFARVGGNRIYRCVMSGLLFTFFVGSAEIDKITKNFALKADGSWLIAQAKIEEIPFLHQAFVAFAKREKAATWPKNFNR